MIERLAVLLHGSVIGWLERPDGAADPSFAYDPAYVADGMGLGLPRGRAVLPPRRSG